MAITEQEKFLKDELESVEKEEEVARENLRKILRRKERILRVTAEFDGCTCGHTIHNWNATRITNHYCPIHKPTY
jgi:hypothetical protein